LGHGIIPYKDASSWKAFAENAGIASKMYGVKFNMRKPSPQIWLFSAHTNARFWQS